MGAYENPPLITQPNYGEIFARNAQNVMAIAKQREEEKKQKQKEKEAKFLQAAERKTEYARVANNIKAGALTENVNQIGLELTDKYFINEDLFAKGEITAEEYATNKAKYESTLNGISSAGSAIRQFGETIKELDLSNYQPNAEVFGLIEAYKQGKVDAEIIDGKLELKYEDPDGNIRDVDEKWLSNTNSWSVVEKFDNDAVTNGLADIIKKQITEQASTTIQTDDAKVTTTEQRYSAAYGTREQRIEQLYNNSIIQGLDQDELGSYYMDKIVPNISADVANELTNILNSENYKDLSEEQKKQIQADVNAGQWSNREFKIGDKTVNSSSILSELSKRQLVKEALNKVPQPKVSTATVLDQRTAGTQDNSQIKTSGSKVLNSIQSAGTETKLQEFTGATLSIGDISGKVVGVTKKSDTDFDVMLEIGSGADKTVKKVPTSIMREDGKRAMKSLFTYATKQDLIGRGTKSKDISLNRIDNEFDLWYQYNFERGFTTEDPGAIGMARGVELQGKANKQIELP